MVKMVLTIRASSLKFSLLSSFVEDLLAREADRLARADVARLDAVGGHVAAAALGQHRGEYLCEELVARDHAVRVDERLGAAGRRQGSGEAAAWRDGDDVSQLWSRTREAILPRASSSSSNERARRRL